MLDFSNLCDSCEFYEDCEPWNDPEDYAEKFTKKKCMKTGEIIFSEEDCDNV